MVVGGLLVSILKHADRVTCACIAQLVNTIAPIRAEPGGRAWRQTTFHPFALTARHAVGTAIPLRLEVPMLATTAHGDVPAVDAVAALEAGSGDATVLLVNRSPVEPIELDLALDGLGPCRMVEHIVLADDDPYARNSTAAPDRVIPRRVTPAPVDAGRVSVSLPAASWTMLRLAPNDPSGA